MITETTYKRYQFEHGALYVWDDDRHCSFLPFTTSPLWESRTRQEAARLIRFGKRRSGLRYVERIKVGQDETGKFITWNARVQWDRNHGYKPYAA